MGEAAARAPAPPRVLGLALVGGPVLLSAIWGTQFLVVRLGQQTVPPLLCVCARFCVVTLAAQAFVLATRTRAPGGGRAWRLAFGLSQAAAMSLLYVSERTIPSSVAAVLFAASPFFVTLLAPLLVPAEPRPGRALAGSALGFAGVATLSLTPAALGGASGLVAGSLLAAGGALAAALNKLVGKRLVADLPPAILLRDMAAVVAASTAVAWWLLERHESVAWTPTALAAVLYLGLIGSAGATGLYLLLLRRLPVTRLAYLQLVTALVGVLTGVVVGGEPWHLQHAAGAATVIAGLLVVLWAPRTTPTMGTLAWERAGGPPLSLGERVTVLTGAGAAVSRTLAARARHRLARGSPPPKVNLSRWALPDSAIARQAETMVRDASTPQMANHSFRSYYFAAILYEHSGARQPLDREALYVAALMHDVALAKPRLPGEHCFTVACAREARALMTAAGWDGARQQSVAAAIVSNLNIRVPIDRFGAEAHYFTIGGMVEVLAQGYKVHPENLAEILARYPRTGYIPDVLDHVRREVALAPGGRFACLGPIFPLVVRRARFAVGEG